MPSSKSSSPHFEKVDLSPFLSHPFPGERGFPTEDHRKCATTINRVFSTNGFLILSNFGPSFDVVDNALTHAREAFKAPFAIKENDWKQFKYSEDGLLIGYRPFGAEHLNMRRAPDFKESFQYNLNDSVNPDILVGVSHPFQASLKAFARAMERGAINVSVALALALDLPHDFFSKHMNDLSRNVVRAIRYPARQFDPSTLTNPRASIRESEHCDIAMMTFTFSDGPGLQIRVEEDGDVGWASFPAPLGASAVVNTGSMLRRWTNDKWAVSLHRCIIEDQIQAEKDRHSLIYHCNPDHDTTLVPSPLLGAFNRETTTAGEYLMTMRKKNRMHENGSR